VKRIGVKKAGQEAESLDTLRDSSVAAARARDDNRD
jgi:hypothetical protein